MLENEEKGFRITITESQKPPVAMEPASGRSCELMGSGGKKIIWKPDVAIQLYTLILITAHFNSSCLLSHEHVVNYCAGQQGFLCDLAHTVCKQLLGCDASNISGIIGHWLKLQKRSRRF